MIGIGPIVTTAGILAVSGGAIGAMLAGWRHRQRKQSNIGTVIAMPTHLGRATAAFDDVHYVGTSLTEHTLERIAIRPLGYRGRADLEIHDSGVAIGITGEAPFFIPVERLETVATAQSTIDRAVERDGLVAVRWLLGDTSVESFFRIVDPAQRQDLISELNTLVVAHRPDMTDDSSASTTTEELA